MLPIIKIGFIIILFKFSGNFPIKYFIRQAGLPAKKNGGNKLQKLDRDQESKMVGVVLTTDQIEWLKAKGKLSTVIREIIEKEIRNEG